jgi:hypothetical protein
MDCSIIIKKQVSEERRRVEVCSDKETSKSALNSAVSVPLPQL